MSTLEAYIKEGTRPHLFTHSLIIIYSKEKDEEVFLGSFSHTWVGRLGFLLLVRVFMLQDRYWRKCRRRSPKGSLGHPQALEARESQAKVWKTLGRLDRAHTCGNSCCWEGRKFQTCSRGRKSVARNRSCVAGRDLTGFDLDKQSMSSDRSNLVLERY